MLPALACRAIESYSEPGDLVLDPMCGIGTTLVELAHLGRRAIGVELEPRWAKLTRKNLEHASDGARLQAQVIDGGARELPKLVARMAQRALMRDPTNAGTRPGKLARMPYAQVDLIVGSPPYGCQIADVSANQAGPLRRQDTFNYSPDRRNLGHARGGDYLEAMAEVYEACAAVLKPGRVPRARDKGHARQGRAAPTSAARRSCSVNASACFTGSASSACSRRSATASS
jgi:modification methylase